MFKSRTSLLQGWCPCSEKSYIRYCTNIDPAEYRYHLNSLQWRNWIFVSVIGQTTHLNKVRKNRRVEKQNTSKLVKRGIKKNCRKVMFKRKK